MGASRNLFSFSHEAGLYTWDLSSDLVYADNALAIAFGLDPTRAQSGLPVLIYVERIHPDDRPRVAEAIHNSILSCGPFQEEYRVMNANGVYTSVVAYGRCFADHRGSPTLYAGIIHPAHLVATEPRLRMLRLMVDAFQIATETDFPVVASTLRPLIEELSEPRDHD